MGFTGLPFCLLFLPLALLAGWALGGLAWAGLLAASLMFYANLGSLPLLLALGWVTLVSYGAGLLMARAPDRQRVPFWAGVAGNLAALLVIRHGLGPAAGFGVSFFVFQAIAYLADLRLGRTPTERHLGHFALFLAFFPKLLQGPIERAEDLLPQLKGKLPFEYDRALDAALLFGWGCFQKTVLADRLALYVNPVYDQASTHSGIVFLLATYAFAFQLYFDFAGYSHMALGAAGLFGIRLSPNFRSPYLATGIPDFWRRWHMTLSRWVLDYLFMPLQLAWRRRGLAGTCLALVTAFTLMGLWHGARWGYLAWGLLQGLYLAGAAVLGPLRKRCHRALGLERTALLRAWQRFATFHLIVLGWVLFRAPTLADARHILATWWRHASLGEVTGFLTSRGGPAMMSLAAGFLAAAAVGWTGRRLGGPLPSRPGRWALGFLLALLILALRADDIPFIYFHF